MKYFNKILLSAISVIAIANCTSYSMDDNLNRSSSVNYQINNNLTEQDKITQNIDGILNKMKEYSNNSLLANTFYLNNRKIALQNQLTRIKEINIEIIEQLKKICFENYDNCVFTLKNISNNDISINNLKNRIKVIEKELKIQYNTNTINGEESNNSSKHSVINNIMHITDNNNVKYLIDIINPNTNNTKTLPVNLSIYNRLNNFKFNQQNNFLANTIQSAKDCYSILENNIHQNNTLIEEVQKIKGDLYDALWNLYLKINSLEDLINSVKNESDILTNQNEKHSDEMKDLQKRLYEIAKKLLIIVDIDGEKRKYKNGIERIKVETIAKNKETSLNRSNVLKKTEELNKKINDANENIIINEKQISNSIDELGKKYKFTSKYYITEILYDIKSMLFKTHEFSLDNDKLLRKKIDGIKLLTYYKNIVLPTDKLLKEKIDKIGLLTYYENIVSLSDKIFNANSHIILQTNKVEHHSFLIRKIQENLCNIEDKLGIKSTISQKYDKIEKEKFGLQLENTDLKRENKNLIDKNKGLDLEKEQLNLEKKQLIDKNKGLNLEKEQLIDKNKGLNLEKEQLINKNKKLHVKNQELYNMLNINEQQNNMDLFSPSSPNMFKNDTEIEKDENNKYLDKNMSIQNKKNEGNNTSSIDSDDSSSESNKTLNKKRNRQDDQNVENKDNIKNNRNEKSKNKNISNKNKKVIEDSDSEQ